MAARGSYAKGIAKREEILTRALDVIARNGYRKTSVRELAAEVGLSQAGLLHYFGTKEELFAATLQKRDAVDSVGLDIDATPSPSAFIAGLTNLLRHNAEVPGLVQLYAQLSVEAAEPDHPAQAFFRERYEHYRSAVAGFIRAAQDAGDLPASLDADRASALLAAATDGLQTQWMLDDSIDMAAHIQYLWERLTAE